MTKWDKKAKKERQIHFLFCIWDIHLFLASDIRAPSSQAFRLWNLYQFLPHLTSQAFGLEPRVTPLPLLVLRPGPRLN
jgi:hypothetical protein